MRILLITGITTAVICTSCQFYGIVRSETPPMTASELSVKHLYQIPKQNKGTCLLSRFNDPQLNQLITVGLVDAPDIRIARSRVMRARQVVKGAFSPLWPSANFNGTVEKDHYKFRGVVPLPFNELIFNQGLLSDLAVNFNYELDFWGKNRENVASKVNKAFAAEMDLAESQLILSSTIGSTYFELQNALVQQRLAKENISLLKEMEEIITTRAKHGIETDIPIKTAISNTQSANLIAFNYIQKEQLSRNQLAILLGKNPFNTQIAVSKMHYNKKELRLPPIISTNVLIKRPDIAAAKSLVEAKAHEINVAKAAFFPDINLRGILSFQSFYFTQFFNISLQTEGAKAALSLPLFDAGARRANLGVKYAEFEFSVNRYNQTILNALREISDNTSTNQTLKKQISDQTKVIKATTMKYQLIAASYRAGIIDYLQLIEIKQALIQEKSTLFLLQTRQKQAFLALLAALGGEIQL